MKTLKTILKQFEDFVATNHQAYSYGYGMINDLQAENRDFPIVWVQSDNGSLTETYIEYKFNIWILNSTMSDKENLKDVMTDMALIGMDLLNSYRQNDDETLSDNIPMTPITIDFDDILSGWVFDFSIKVETTYC